jgi:N-acetylglucosamine-6-phosphate deacetylase
MTPLPGQESDLTDMSVGVEKPARSWLLSNANLYAPEPLGPGGVRVEGGQIAAVYRIGEAMPEGDVIDLGGAALGPGFIDVHAHGADGVDVMDGSEAIARVARFFARHGVTSFLPTTVTASWDAIERAVEGVRQAMATEGGGARVLGAHLEGPFLSAQRLGAQSPDFCILPTPAHVARLLQVAGDVAQVVTLAPEIEGGMDAIRALSGRGIVASIGHTAASEGQAAAAFAAGARHVTHLFNGMPPMHHRSPGVIGAALATPEVTVELIADGVHLAPAVVRLAVAAKGVGGVLLVTDAMAAAGCVDGQYLLGPVTVYVRDGQARLAEGNLAGSTLTLERAVVHVAGWTDAGLGGAWQMASLNPARLLGIAGHAGRLAPGYDADLTALDAAGRVVLTMVGGKVVYRAAS